MALRFIFTDTSAWYAIIDRNDVNHTAALQFIEKLDRPLLTSNFIIDEILTLIKNRLGYDLAVDLGQKLWNQEIAKVSRVTEKDEQAAWKIFVQYRDKGFSFTDCTSFVLMDRLKVNTAFTFDDHFIQYGEFLKVPPPSHQS